MKFFRKNEGAKTPSQLLKELDKKTTVDQLEEDVELQVLRMYLVHVASRAKKDAKLYPMFPYNDILRRKMNYNPVEKGGARC